jgi:hypothetical protein
VPRFGIKDGEIQKEETQLLSFGRRELHRRSLVKKMRVVS